MGLVWYNSEKMTRITFPIDTKEIEDDLVLFDQIEESKLAPIKRHKFLRWLGRLLNVYIPRGAVPFRIKGKKCDWCDGIVVKTGTPYKEVCQLYDKYIGWR